MPTLETVPQLNDTLPLSSLAAATLRDQSATIADHLSNVEHRSHAARIALAEQLATMAAREDAPLGPIEWGLLDDILMRLIEHIEASLRKRIARRIAGLDIPPQGLMRALALDEIDIAGDLLRNARMIGEPLLREVVRTMSSEHRIAVAGRSNLAANVSNDIVDSRDGQAIRTLLRNDSARLSKPAVRKLVDRAADETDLQTLLVLRNDMPRGLLSDMFWWVASEVRNRIIDRFDVDLAYLERRFQEGADDAYRELIADPIAAMTINRIHERSAPRAQQIDALWQGVRQRNLAKTLDALVRATGLTRSAAHSALIDETGEPIAIIGKVLGLQRTQFVQFHLALDVFRSRSLRPYSQVDRLSKLYDRLSPDGAQFLLSYWNEKQNLHARH